MPTLTIDDAELYFETHGDGPPLLLIAGLASDSASWGPVAPLLSKEFTLIMPDNRGCGRTKDDGGALSIDQFANDCRALLDHLEIEKATVLGHSMGGVTAMRLAASAPDRVKHLFLAASAPATPARARSVIDTLIALREAGAPEDEWHRAFFSLAVQT